MSRVLLLALFWSLTVFVSSSGSVIAEQEASSLFTLKSSLIDPLDSLGDWKPSGSDHCNFTGIRCNADGFVEGLDLSHKNLSGVISFDPFRSLSALARLNLCCNSLSGFLPESFPFLTNLEELDLSDNDFEGSFPFGIASSFPGLRILNASGNNFAGLLPVGLSNASLLETLDLRGGFFTGKIPTGYKNLHKLRFLGLSGNNLGGRIPAELGQLTDLETLIIGYNGFDGAIPAEIGNLTDLRYLDMAVGNLSGPIPAEFGKLSHLSVVYLYRNNLMGEIPRTLGNLLSLVSLDLSDNSISGIVPPELGRLSNLQLLNLMCNKLEGSLPPGLGRLPRLQILEVWNNSLAGPLPASLGRNSSLKWLDVSSNSFSGEIPPGLCDGESLSKLILFNNNFSGQIPAGLSGCLSLTRVRLQSNRLSGALPAGIGRLPRLQRLELADNEISGEVPQEFSSSPSLSFIDLSRNHLRLPLPSNILSIPTLQSFIAAGNGICGQIPGDVESCPALASLDLSGNGLTGEIPGSLGSCQRLISLNLGSNGLSGEIPAAMALMPALAILDLSHNSLTGPIPASFGASPALEHLNVSHNRLSGAVPATNGFLSFDDLAGNPGLCGGVLLACASGGLLLDPSQHVRRVLVGWLAGLSAVLAAGGGILLARRVYARWQIGAGCFGGGDGGGGAWPWRLTAFQRVSFTSSEVLACVKESNVIGMGATGVVYRAELQRHRAVVAVKKLWRSGGGEEAEFVGEVNLLGRLRHRNIVRMLGYLRNDEDTMLLYEYVPNGSLWEALHGEGGLLLDWVSRYNVAAGVANGLAYLHHDCHPPVIHRDVKSSNILLDAALEARIADFGLARTILKNSHSVSTVAGSYGYIAPEYGYTLKVDQKSDIYSFGVVLMELVTGKRPVETEFGEDQDIVGWTRQRLRSDRPSPAADVLDRAIAGQCKHVQEEMLLLLRIALLCTSPSPRDRPSMRNILTMLAEAKPRRKSSSAAAAAVSLSHVPVAKDVRPVFTTAPPDTNFV